MDKEWKPNKGCIGERCIYALFHEGNFLDCTHTIYNEETNEHENVLEVNADGECMSMRTKIDDAIHTLVEAIEEEKILIPKEGEEYKISVSLVDCSSEQPIEI